MCFDSDSVLNEIFEDVSVHVDCALKNYVQVGFMGFGLLFLLMLGGSVVPDLRLRLVRKFGVDIVQDQFAGTQLHNVDVVSESIVGESGLADAPSVASTIIRGDFIASTSSLARVSMFAGSESVQASVVGTGANQDLVQGFSSTSRVLGSAVPLDSNPVENVSHRTDHSFGNALTSTQELEIVDRDPLGVATFIHFHVIHIRARRFFSLFFVIDYKSH